jgi:hypothetical protein
LDDGGRGRPHFRLSTLVRTSVMLVALEIEPSDLLDRAGIGRAGVDGHYRH